MLNAILRPELKEFEIKILSAKDKIIALEHELYPNNCVY